MPRKILYIEDDAESRDLMADLLGYHGFKFFGASKGLEGLRIATREHPDLILMDINLPDMQGYELTTLIKSISDLQSIPIIALTAEVSDGARERTLTAGCTGYISKPINLSDFMVRIESFLEGHAEKVEPDREKQLLTEYNVRLVSKLQNKVEELEKVNLNLKQINEELNLSREQLTDYNNRLFYMNKLSNLLRIQESPEALLQLLPHKIIEGFGVDRCIIFEHDNKTNELTLIQGAGVSLENMRRVKLHLDNSYFATMDNDQRVVWIRHKKEILDESLFDLAQKLNSVSFLIGYIPTGTNPEAVLNGPSLTDPENRDMPGNIEGLDRRLVFFIDRGRTQERFATYEVRVLKSMMQSAAIVHENMLLYHRLIRLYRIKEQEAITDPLTGVFNYRYFRWHLEREIVRSQRNGQPFSIAMIDIDNFKQLNDTYGHQRGDRLLQFVAETLVQNTRKSDIVARCGGDEFMIILPELDKNRAFSLAEKLCRIIGRARLPKQKNEQVYNLTISLGVSTYPDDGDMEKVLIQKADEALYRAKTQGRNTVCISA
jgi:diguanylate cyclase (GGDEF)-like protein